MKRLLFLLLLSTQTWAISDKDYVQNMPHTGLANPQAPGVEFTLKQDMTFPVGDYRFDLASEGSKGQCEFSLSIISDRTNERVMKSGKKLRLMYPKFVNNSETSGHIFYLSYNAPQEPSKVRIVSINCYLSPEQFASYTYGDLKKDLSEYFDLKAPSVEEL